MGPLGLVWAESISSAGQVRGVSRVVGWWEFVWFFAGSFVAGCRDWHGG